MEKEKEVDWRALSQKLGEITNAVRSLTQEMRSLTITAERNAEAQVPVMRKVEVFVLQGPAGSGKTSAVRKVHPDAYFANTLYRDSLWEGYSGEEVIVLDDFDFDIPCRELLRILDKWPYKAQVWHAPPKEARWTKVFITTCHTWEETTANWPADIVLAFERRIPAQNHIEIKNTSDADIWSHAYTVNNQMKNQPERREREE